MLIVSGLQFNLLYVSKLDVSEYKVVFKKGTATIFKEKIVVKQ